MQGFQSLLDLLPPVTYGSPSTDASKAYDWYRDLDWVHREVVSVRTLLLLAALYVPAVFLLQGLMKGRKAFTLRWPLFFWNVALALFSGVAGYYVNLHILIPLVFERGLWGSVCALDGYDHPLTYWVMVFNYTKALEWIDTLFLILR